MQCHIAPDVSISHKEKGPAAFNSSGTFSHNSLFMKQRRNHIPDPRKDTGDAVEHISLRVVALIHLCSGALILFLDFTGTQNDLHGTRGRVLLRCQGYRLCVHIDIQNGAFKEILEKDIESYKTSRHAVYGVNTTCLLYTSDAADD